MVKLTMFIRKPVKDVWGEEDLDYVVVSERTYYSFNKARRAIPRLSKSNPYAYITVRGTDGRSKVEVDEYFHCTGERKPENMYG